MNGERLRLGAFGVGRMGQVHLEHLIALHQAGGIELVAMGDRFGPTLSSASRLLNELGGRDLARMLVVTGRRGADEHWRQLQRDQASLSERGCLIIAEQSGHVVPIDQPDVIVDAIRIVVETARDHDGPLCATPAPNVHRDPPRP